MNAHRFSIAGALRYGWRTTLDNLAFFVGLGLLYAAITLILNGIVFKVNAYSEGWAFFIGIIALIAGIIMDVGLTVISLRFVDGRKARVADLFIHYPIAPAYFIASLFAVLMVFVGLVLLIVPGIFLMVLFQFYAFHVVDEGTGAVLALRRSAETTRGERWRLFLFGLLAVLINVGGALCLLVGLFLTVPVTFLAYGRVFRRLQTNGSGVRTAEVSVP